MKLTTLLSMFFCLTTNLWGQRSFEKAYQEMAVEGGFTLEKIAGIANIKSINKVELTVNKTDKFDTTYIGTSEFNKGGNEISSYSKISYIGRTKSISIYKGKRLIQKTSYYYHDNNPGDYHIETCEYNKYNKNGQKIYSLYSNYDYDTGDSTIYQYNGGLLSHRLGFNNDTLYYKELYYYNVSGLPVKTEYFETSEYDNVDTLVFKSGQYYEYDTNNLLIQKRDFVFLAENQIDSSLTSYTYNAEGLLVKLNRLGNIYGNLSRTILYRGFLPVVFSNVENTYKTHVFYNDKSLPIKIENYTIAEGKETLNQITTFEYEYY